MLNNLVLQFWLSNIAAFRFHNHELLNDLKIIISELNELQWK